MGSERAPLWPLAAILALALAGCGADGLSSAQLRNQATQVCSVAGKLTDRVPAPGSPAQGAAFLSSGAAVLRRELRQLHALKASGEAVPVFATAVGAFSQKLAAVQSTARNLSAGGDPVIEIKTLQQQLVPIQQQEDAAWQRLGIPACVNR